MTPKTENNNNALKDKSIFCSNYYIFFYDEGCGEFNFRKCSFVLFLYCTIHSVSYLTHIVLPSIMVVFINHVNVHLI